MEILSKALFCIAIIILLVVLMTLIEKKINNKVRSILLSIACLFLVLTLVFEERVAKSKIGKPAPLLNILTTGEKYNVVAIYDGKYIAVKPNTKEEKLIFIGPLDFGTLTSGKYIKTATGNIEKLEQ